MSRALDVCVVGGGVSGLVAIKELLDEGHRVTCFEQEREVGGNFTARGLAYQEMRLTISQYFMAYSSFAPDLAEDPRFWTRLEYLDYLNRFSRAFDLQKHIVFGAGVQSIKKSADQKFLVGYEYDGGATQRQFDAVALCVGAFRSTRPRLPTFNGRESFSGEIVHTAAYQDPSPFKGKRVVCVGMGETSADVTKQISDVAQACWLSIRNYPTLISRYPRGRRFTTDANTTRIINWSAALLGAAVEERFFNALAKEELECQDPHRVLVADWAMKSDRRRFLQKNDEFVGNVLNGKIEVIPFGIRALRGNRVEFTDGTSVEADTIMCCTGYEESAIPQSCTNNVVISDTRSLFMNAFHPELGPRFVFVGWVRPMQGAVPACSEMVSRYFSLLCSGKVQLPESGEMAATIAKHKTVYDARFSGVPYIRTLVLYTKFMDKIAEFIGCKPDLEQYIDDPELLYRLVCATNIPATYRLRGPHADPEGAKTWIRRLEVSAQGDRLQKAFYKEMLPHVLEGRVNRALVPRMCAIINERLDRGPDEV